VAPLNPFIYDDPVPSTDLIDRHQETKTLLDLAEGAHNARLQAPRRYGKTSLLLHVLEDADKKGYRQVYVDFLGVSTTLEAARRIEEAYRQSLNGVLRRTVARIAHSWRGRAKAAPGGVGGEIEYTGKSDLNQRLSDLLDLPKKVLAGGERTIVVFDEFQDFLRAEPGLAGLLRSKTQHHRDAASYIFCGSEHAFLESAFSDRGKPLFDQARPLYLGPLSDRDLGDYIADRFAATGKDPGEALDPCLELVRGHPQRAMLLAHHLWECTPDGGVADLDTYSSALGATDRELADRFEFTWSSYAGKPNLRRVLKALARSPETLYNKRTLAAFELSKGQAQAGERGLKRADEIHEVNGQPQIIDPLFERWLANTDSSLDSDSNEPGD
jgi:hypothetical protein